MSNSVTTLDSILSREVTIELVLQSLKPPPQFLLVFGGNRVVSFDLTLSEVVESVLKISGLDRDLFHGVVEIELALDRRLDRFVTGIADERIAGPDVEVDIGQRFDADVLCRRIGFNLSGKLEKEPELTDFNPLFHDIDTEEVVENDAL
jgi:hypothetical protein